MELWTIFMNLNEDKLSKEGHLEILDKKNRGSFLSKSKKENEIDI